MIKKNRILSILFVSLFMSSTLFVGVGLTSVSQVAHSSPDQGVVPAGYPSTDLDNRNSPVSILIYNEFADTTTAAPLNEFRNTLDSISDTYGDNFRYDNLTAYTQLTARLSNYDVFLIAEQENLNQSDVTAIASAWDVPLTAFVNGGGILIVMDCNGVSPSDLSDGPTMKILNETGLMTVYNPSDGFMWTNTLVDTSDALARGVDASWSAADGTVLFDTTDATVVVEYNSHAIVAHKIMGAGHIVLLGFDFFTREPNYDTLLANAIRLHRHVVFDNSHDNLNSVTSGYSTFAEDIAIQGFAVSGMNTFDADYLQAAEILVISAADYHGIAEYTISELDIIEEFVSSGGGLFIISDGGTWGNVTDPVNERFGMFRNVSYSIWDTDDFNPAGSGYSVIYSGAENINNHSTTLMVNTIETWVGSGLESYPAGTFPIITTDVDGTASLGLTKVVNGMPFAAAVNYNDGRIIFIGDSDLFSDDDTDSDAIINYYDMNSEQFARNCIGWLSAAGIKEKIVVFDESHAPNCHTYDWLAGLGILLTENGYTIKWMTDFLPGLIAGADILFALDGTIAYTPTEIATITSFVANGGGLYLVGAWGEYIAEVEPIGHEFGFGDTNLTDLYDTDDSVGPPNYIVYDGANIGNHPITQGVSRVELYRSGIIQIPGSSISSIITTDIDGTSDYLSGDPADGLTVMAATTYNKGRVVFFADYLSFRWTFDDDSDGVPNLYDADNSLLFLNTFYWLSENRAPSVTLTFPNGGEVLNGTQSVTWDSNDFDSDSLTFEILYSDNNGTDWTSLATGVTANQFEWNTTLHDDGTDYMIRVVAFDGELSASDDSDNPFELDNFAEGGGLPFGIDIMTLLLILAIIAVLIILGYLCTRRQRDGGPPPKKAGAKKTTKKK